MQHTTESLHTAQENIYSHKVPVIVSNQNIPLDKTNVKSDMHLYFPETRIFNHHSQLDEILKQGHTILTWINIEKNQQMSYSQESICLMIVTAGYGQLTYQGNQMLPIKSGDTVIMPAEFDCDIQTASTHENLQFLLFAKETYTPECSDDIDSFHKLISYNNHKFQQMLKLPFIKFLENPQNITLEQAKVFLACMQLFSNIFQRMIFIRQATCNVPHYEKIFLDHFQEEFGHDKLLADRVNNTCITDPVLTAILSWFPYQMFLTDNPGKAALVHLVWEIMGEKAHSLAKPLKKYVNSNFFELHEEHDKSHAEIGMELMKNLHVSTYQNLKVLLDEAWDMFTEALDRVMFLINNNR